jgi:crotonobetainyl-CoA:carnitine CoA-transferase CaiB-like acyl-CoA transferase
LASQGLVTVTVKEGVRASLPALPLRMGKGRAGLRYDVPKAGEHSREILSQALGLGSTEIDALERSGAFA